MINYQEIVENLKDDKVIQLLDSFDIPYEDFDDYILMPTVCHNDNSEDASWKLYYYKNSHLFVCYTECGNMSIFNFLKHYYEARDIEYDWYKDILQVVLNCSAARITKSDEQRYKSIKENYARTKNIKELPTFNNGIINTFIEYYPIEWINDGISKNTMKKFNIRYSISQNKIIIPHYDAVGRLVGIRGRALNPMDIEIFGKYMPVQIEGQWYSHPLSLNLYGLNINKDNIKKTGIAFLVEAEKSVMQADEFKIPNCCVAVCGSKINKFHMDLLMKTCNPRHVIVAFDNEEESYSDKYFNKLYSMCSKYKNYTEMSFIYDRKKLTKLKDSPTDCGEEVFRKLINERVIIK